MVYGAHEGGAVGVVEYVATCYASAEVKFEALADATKAELRERVRENVETGDLGELQVREVQRVDE